MVRVNANKYPWMVAIRRKIQDPNVFNFYTGTLVSDQFVVTAASVVKGYAFYMFEAKPGATRFGPDSSTPPIMDWQLVEELWVHPYYQSDEKPSNKLSYDVGLLKLGNKVDFFHFLGNIGIGPICLPSPNQKRTVQDYVRKEGIKGSVSIRDGGDVKPEILSNEYCLRHNVHSQKFRQVIKNRLKQVCLTLG